MTIVYTSLSSFLGTSLITTLSAFATAPPASTCTPFPLEVAPIEAYFDAATLQSILNDENCTGVRFYTVVPASGSTVGSIVAIGIDANGEELNGGLFASAYRQFDGNEGDRILIKNLSRSKASDGCVRYSDMGGSAYSASFPAADLNALLAIPDCGGLRVTQEQVGPDMSLKLGTVALADGKITSLGSGSEYERICTDPCPTVCGPDKNYLRMR